MFSSVLKYTNSLKETSLQTRVVKVSKCLTHENVDSVIVAFTTPGIMSNKKELVRHIKDHKSLDERVKICRKAGNLREQLMSRDWLRHSTVDSRTLRPLSMVHFSPCRQPCRPSRTHSSVQQTCHNGRRGAHVTTELQRETQREMDHKT